MREKRKGGKAIPTQRIRKWRNPALSRSSAVLLLWAHAGAPLFRRLCTNVTREIASYLCFPTLIPDIIGSRLYVVNILTREYRSVPAPSADIVQTFFVQIHNTKALCIITADMQNLNCYWVDLVHLTFTPVLSHTFQRFPYTFYFTGRLYFIQDGNNPGEKYEIASGKWTSLQAFQAPLIQVAFAYQNLIFMIVFNYYNTYCQAFDTSTDTFRPPVQLDLIPRCFMGSVFAVSGTEQLVLFYDCGKHTVDLWSCDWEHSTIQVKKGNQFSFRGARTSGYTLLVGKQLYWLEAYKLEVHNYDLEKGKRQWRVLKQQED